MPKNIAKNVSTSAVGFAPILQHYYKQCSIADIIDNHVATDPPAESVNPWAGMCRHDYRYPVPGNAALSDHFYTYEYLFDTS